MPNQYPGEASSPKLLSVPNLSSTIAEALEAMNGAHNRLDALEDRVSGSQPRNPEAAEKPRDGLTSLAVQLRASVMILNNRLDKLHAAI